MLSQADYTVLRARRGNVFAANFLTGSLDILDSRCMSSENRIETASLNDSERNYLLRRGHLQYSENAQVTELTHLWNEYRLKTRLRCYVYVQLTLACNLRCTYCFQGKEGHPQLRMSIGTLKEVELFLEGLADSFGDPSRLVVVLYGGEPLMASNLSAIDDLLRFCEHEHISVRVISNGVNLQQFIPLFKTSGGLIEGVTITLDGDRARHDASRVFPDGLGSYGRVASSIFLARDENIDVTIRMNVSPDLVGEIRHGDWRLADIPYEVHRVESRIYGEAISFRDLLDLCLNGFLDVSEMAVNQVSYFLQMFEEDQDHYPLFHDCYPGSVVLVSPSGSIYGCNEISDETTLLGSVGKDCDSFLRQFKSAFMGQALHLDNVPCLRCPVYPVCGGGCPHRRGDVSDFRCCNYFGDIIEMLDFYIDWKLGAAVSDRE